jgi:hypothetical protein
MTWVAGALNIGSEALVLLLLFGLGNIALPIGVTLVVAWLSRMLAGARHSLRAVLTAFAPAFVPLGLGIWIAHYGFHFLLGALTLIPVFQNFLVDHYIFLLGEPDWSLGGLSGDVITPIQVVALVGGFLWSMVVAQRVALRLYGRRGMLGLLPWALLLLGVVRVALWIFGLPMEMRGTVLFD